MFPMIVAFGRIFLLYSYHCQWPGKLLYHPWLMRLLVYKFKLKLVTTAHSLCQWTIKCKMYSQRSRVGISVENGFFSIGMRIAFTNARGRRRRYRFFRRSRTFLYATNILFVRAVTASIPSLKFGCCLTDTLIIGFFLLPFWSCETYENYENLGVFKAFYIF